MIEKKIENLVKSHIESLGYEFLGVEYFSVKSQKILRIYVDNNPSITMKDCVTLNNHVSTILDIEDPISDEYSLEISSPGLDRPLFTMSHYIQSINKNVKIKLTTPVSGSLNIKGKILSVSEDKIFLELLNDSKDKLITLRLDDIRKSNIIFEY